jgi:hypothetical protein
MRDSSGVRLWDVVPALVDGIDPYPHDRARGGIAEPLVRWKPASGRLSGLSVPAPPFDRTRLRARRVSELRQVGDRRGRLVQVRRAQYQTHPPVQFLMVELAQGVMLTDQGNETFAVGLRGQGPRSAWRGTRHRYSVGRTTTAVP